MHGRKNSGLANTSTIDKHLYRDKKTALWGNGSSSLRQACQTVRKVIAPEGFYYLWEFNKGKGLKQFEAIFAEI